MFGGFYGMGFGYPMFNRLPNYNYNNMYRPSPLPNYGGYMGGLDFGGGFRGGLTPQALAQIQQAQQRAMDIARLHHQKATPSPATAPAPEVARPKPVIRSKPAKPSFGRGGRSSSRTQALVNKDRALQAEAQAKAQAKAQASQNPQEQALLQAEAQKAQVEQARAQAEQVARKQAEQARMGLQQHPANYAPHFGGGFRTMRFSGFGF